MLAAYSTNTRPRQGKGAPLVHSKSSLSTEIYKTAAVNNNNSYNSKGFEFGGSLGTLALIIGLPLLIYYMRVPLSLGLADLLDILRFRGRLLRPPAGFHWLRQAHRSAFASFYVMIVVMAALYITEYFPIYTLPDEFGPIMPVAIVSGVLTSVYAYGSAWACGAQHRTTG
ncbi:hypothetical protein EYZ11_012448 [Aspergillus tanneri]|uniref:Uncharacterized protein n=1 Tax=Aspergillus tanneri TaxID=1220188 RepID=A0A4S3J078_9EURO|nr:hypothetical protein EYZ11_012448 [Aspergillus tanneri]